ncbi:MAG: hypothetical protein H6832_16040 [Planctomycetes bacterium]|nr:hypothetical protein [Planctomycetota bacterium]
MSASLRSSALCVVDLEWRLQLFVLEHDENHAVCAAVASRRKAATTDAYRATSVCIAELRRADGTLRLLGELGSNDTSFLEQLLPQVAVSGAEERTQSHAIDVTQFGLQQADTTIPVRAKRHRVDGSAASEWMRTTFSLAGDEPVTVQSGDTSMTVEAFEREFVIDEKAGRLVSTRSTANLLVHGTEQTRTSSFRLSADGRTSIESPDLRLLRELRDATILMQTDPVRALSQLRGLAKEDEAEGLLVELVTKDAEQAAERARADEAWRSKVAALIGKVAPHPAQAPRALTLVMRCRVGFPFPSLELREARAGREGPSWW